jgi:hypothetical protein
MAEGVETHVSPVVAARGHASPCRPAPPPPPSRLAVLDWGRVSFGVPRRKIILLGLSVFGVAGIYVLVKNGKLTFPDLSDMPDPLCQICPPCVYPLCPIFDSLFTKNYNHKPKKLRSQEL